MKQNFKVMGERGAKVIYLSIFRNTLLIIRTSFNDYFVAERLFVRRKASGCAHVVWSLHIRSWKEQSNPK